MNRYQRIDSNWIKNKIPWKMVRGKYLFNNLKKINSGLEENNLLSLTLNGVVRKDINSGEGLRPETYETYQVFEKDNLVFKLIDLENVRTSRVGWVPEEGLMSPVYIRLQSKNHELNTKYFYYYYYDLYRKEIYNSLGSGVRSSLTGTDLLDLLVPIPRLKEQNKIVDYLETKITKIDSTIKLIKQKINLLQERKNSTINELVTKGINRNCERKETEIEWVGEVPSHWDIVPLLKVCDNIKEKNIDQEETVLTLSYGNLKVRDVEKNFGLLPDSFDTYQRIRPGYIVMRLLDLQNDKKSLRVGHSYLDGIITPVYVSLKCKDEMNTEYLYYFLHNCDVKKVFYSLGGGLRQTLRFEEFKRFSLTLPPIEEQVEIVKRIKKEIKKIDLNILSEENRTQLLNEFKYSLISEVVTGTKRLI